MASYKHGTGGAAAQGIIIITTAPQLAVLPACIILLLYLCPKLI